MTITPVTLSGTVCGKWSRSRAVALVHRAGTDPGKPAEVHGNRRASSRFANIDFPNRRGEIGWTWIARPWQRTQVNTEAKYLMLQHAFETLGFIRVEFKADSLNERSRTAILRIGAKQESLFRNRMVCEDGRIRHSESSKLRSTSYAERRTSHVN